MVLTPVSQGDRWLTIVLFTLAMTGAKAYLPAFWTLPSETHVGGGGSSQYRSDQLFRKPRRSGRSNRCRYRS